MVGGEFEFMPVRKLILIAVFALAACRSPQSLPDDSLVYESSSPSGLYTIRLTGNGDRPTFLTNQVDVTVLKEGVPYISNEYIHSGDSFDLSFNYGFPRRVWLDDNTIRFFNPRETAADKKYTVSVRNSSTVKIKFLKLFTTDKFVILDLEPGSSAKLAFSEPLGDRIDFYLLLVFDNGKRLEQGATFPAKAETRDFYINAETASILIEAKS
jgi:hypothetical protein